MTTVSPPPPFVASPPPPGVDCRTEAASLDVDNISLPGYDLSEIIRVEPVVGIDRVSDEWTREELSSSSAGSDTSSSAPAIEPIALVPFTPPNRPPPPPPSNSITSIPPTPIGPNRPISMYTDQPWADEAVVYSPVLQGRPPSPPPTRRSSSATPATHPPSTPTSSSSSTAALPLSDEDAELERVLALSKLTALSETVSRSWSEGAEPGQRVELELDERERDQLERTRREEQDLKKALEESLRVTASPSREHWVDLDFWDTRNSSRSTFAAASVAHSTPTSPLIRTSTRSLPPPPPPPPPPQAAPFFQASLPSPFDSPIHPSHSFPDRLTTTSFSALAESPMTSPTLTYSGVSARPQQPAYSRTSSLPVHSSTATSLRSGTTRRHGTTPPLSLYVANPSDDTPLADLVEASYANASKGKAESFRSSALPTIRGDQWEGASVEGGRTPPPPLTPSDEAAETRPRIVSPTAEPDTTEVLEGNAEETAAFDLEPDEQEIELQRARREAMARESFVIDEEDEEEEEEISPEGSGSSASFTMSSGGPGGSGMVREPSSSSSLAEEEQGAVTPEMASSNDACWSGLSESPSSFSIRPGSG